MPIENLVVQILAHIWQKGQESSSHTGLEQTYFPFDTVPSLWQLVRPFSRKEPKKMPEPLSGNLLVAQSGGPTAVINSSIAGVISEAGRHECIEEI